MSPLSASMFCTPCSRSLASSCATCSLVEDTQVRCARDSTPKRLEISEASSTVYALVPPPAPYVTLMKAGCSPAIVRAFSATDSYVSPARGGKTS